MNISPAQNFDDIELGLASTDNGRRKSASHLSLPPLNTLLLLVHSIASDTEPCSLSSSYTVAMDRTRNALAARKSRERKAPRYDNLKGRIMKFEDLKARIAKLEAERDHWKQIVLAQTGAQSH